MDEEESAGSLRSTYDEEMIFLPVSLAKHSKWIRVVLLLVEDLHKWVSTV